MTCGACGGQATLQWARRATGAESGQVEQVSAARRAADVERVRDGHRSTVHELKHRISLIPADDPDGPGMVERLEAAIGDAQVLLANVADPPAVVESAEPDTVPVFGCERHALDPDSAALLHDADCAAPAGKCRCAL